MRRAHWRFDVAMTLALLAIVAALALILPGCARTAISPAQVNIEKRTEAQAPRTSSVQTFTFRVWPAGQGSQPDPGEIVPPDRPIQPGPLAVPGPPANDLPLGPPAAGR